MLHDKLPHRRTHFPWRLFLLAAGLLLAFVPMFFDFLRARQLELAARQLDKNSVMLYAQRRTDRASLDMFGARLNAITDEGMVGPSRVAECFQQLRSVVNSSRDISLLRMEYSHDQWMLDLRVKSLSDIKELKQGWQALGYLVEVDRLCNSKQQLCVQIKLKQERR